MLKVLLNRRRFFFFKLFSYTYIWTCTYFHCCYCLYICVKKLSSFMLGLQKNNYFLSFQSLVFHSKIHKHPACKMNRGEQSGSRSKIRSLEWTYFLNDPKVFFVATKTYILIFNLTHSLTSLIGSFHFLQWKIFFPIHW